MNDLKTSLEILKDSSEHYQQAKRILENARTGAAQEMLDAGIDKIDLFGKTFILRKLTGRRRTYEGWERYTSGYSVKIGPDSLTRRTMAEQTQKERNQAQ